MSNVTASAKYLWLTTQWNFLRASRRLHETYPRPTLISHKTSCSPTFTVECHDIQFVYRQDPLCSLKRDVMNTKGIYLKPATNPALNVGFIHHWSGRGTGNAHLLHPRNMTQQVQSLCHYNLKKPQSPAPQKLFTKFE